MTGMQSPRSRILIHTPAFVQNGRHAAMIAVQAKLARRLRRYLPPEIEVISGLIVDHCDPAVRLQIEDLSREFDLVKWSIPEEHGTTWGIRQGTNYAVTDVAREAEATHVLRIIQDTYVFDVIALAELIKHVVLTPGDWIASKIDHWPVTSHDYLCREMGLECDGDLRYSNGELMMAPVATWRRWYVTLPATIHHYWDDVMMSESFRQRAGGRRFDWKPCWVHRHNLDELTSRRIAPAHEAALALSSKPSPGAGVRDSTRRLCNQCHRFSIPFRSGEQGGASLIRTSLPEILQALLPSRRHGNGLMRYLSCITRRSSA